MEEAFPDSLIQAVTKIIMGEIEQYRTLESLIACSVASSLYLLEEQGLLKAPTTRYDLVQSINTTLERNYKLGQPERYSLFHVLMNK